MDTDKLIKSNTEFVDTIKKYYVDSYTMNDDRLAEMAAHGISLRRQLAAALVRISELTAALQSATNQETQS